MNIQEKFNELGIKVEIDHLRLEDEWTRHPQMVLNASMLTADCQKEMDDAKARVDSTLAELDRSIRSNPVQYNIGKVTNDALEMAVKDQPEYKAAIRGLNDARYNLAQAQAMSNALEHRKRALSMLVELWIKDYYSDHSSSSLMGAVLDRGRRRLRQKQDEADDEGG